MNIKSVAKHGTKAVVAVGLGVGGYIAITNLMLLITVGAIGATVFYFKELRKVMRIGSLVLDKAMSKAFPLFAMNVKIEELRVKKELLDNKLVNINGKLKEIEERIIQANRSENNGGIITSLEKSKEVVLKYKERLEGLGVKTANSISAVKENLESRKIVYETLSDTRNIVKDVKDIVGDNNDSETNTDNIDISLAGLYGELEELSNQLDSELG